MIANTSCGLGSAGSSIGTGVGGTVIAFSALAGPAAPIVAAVGALIILGSAIAGALHIGEGCGATCIQATQVVNSAEPTFKMNVDYYESGVIDQPTAINNFNQMRTAIEQACGGIPGTAGSNCVSDRFTEGGCKWSNASGCWNWLVGYRDPLLKPSTTPYSGTNASSISGVVSSLESLDFSSPLVIGGALLLVGLMVGGKD